MKPPLESELLKTFVTIIETQSFTLSADFLRRTQPAISMQMKRLEEAVGKPLFDRTRRGVRLTREGDVLLHYARRILALNAEAQERLEQTSLHGTVRLGTSDDYANILLPEILNRFSESHPHVQIELFCDNGLAIERRLHDGSIDLALVGCRGDMAKKEFLRTEDLVWIAAEHHQPDERPVRIAAFPQGCVCRDAMIEALERLDLEWQFAFSSDNIRAIHQAVQSGLAITAVERSLIPDGVRELGTADGLPELGKVTLGLKVSRKAHSAALDALADDIRATLAADPSVNWPFPREKMGYAEAG